MMIEEQGPSYAPLGQRSEASRPRKAPALDSDIWTRLTEIELELQRRTRNLPVDDGGGSATITHPFQISDASTGGTAKINVRYGTLQDIPPDDVATDLTMSSGTNTIYIHVTVDIDGVVTAAEILTGTSGQPADTDYDGYITLGTVVSDGATNSVINQAATHSLRCAMCGRVVSAGPTLDEAGTFEFWGF